MTPDCRALPSSLVVEGEYELRLDGVAVVQQGVGDGAVLVHARALETEREHAEILPRERDRPQVSVEPTGGLNSATSASAGNQRYQGGVI